MGLVAASKPAAAQSTGPDGKIAYGTNDFDIYVMNADGTNPLNLTNSPDASESGPVWSPDGTRIAYVRSHYYPNGFTYNDIYVMNADGSDRTNLTRTSENDEFSPTWSPDSRRIAFVKSEVHPTITEDWGIFVMNADGSNVDSLTNDVSSLPYEESTPAWSPVDNRIAFSGVRDGKRRIMVMDDKGNGQKVLSSSGLYDHDQNPAWSPDGTKITFMRELQEEGYQWDVFVMNASDGSEQTNLTQHPNGDMFPTFSPDGTKIAFTSNRDTWMQDIYLIDVPGATAPVTAANVLSPEAAAIAPAAAVPVAQRLHTSGVGGSLDWQKVRASASVQVVDYAFTPKIVSVQQGQTVTWSFEGFSYHTVTDSTSMGLFDSGHRAPGATPFSFAFFAAGGYSYLCHPHPTMRGTVYVPVKVSAATGSVTTKFVVTWSSVTAPTGYVYDIQIKRPGSTAFANWKVGRTVRRSLFVADAGKGEYSFRARLRKLSSDGRSMYSLARRITVN